MEHWMLRNTDWQNINERAMATTMLTTANSNARQQRLQVSSKSRRLRVELYVYRRPSRHH
jgi:hypothetical protein